MVSRSTYVYKHFSEFLLLKVYFQKQKFAKMFETTKRDMTRLEAAEMHCLRSVKGCTRLDKIRSEIIRKELEIPGIQDIRIKYKQNWKSRLERTDDIFTRHALNYKPRGRRGSWTPQETMATRRCWNRSKDLIHGGRRRR